MRVTECVSLIFGPESAGYGGVLSTISRVLFTLDDSTDCIIEYFKFDTILNSTHCCTLGYFKFDALINSTDRTLLSISSSVLVVLTTLKSMSPSVILVEL